MVASAALEPLALEIFQKEWRQCLPAHCEATGLQRSDVQDSPLLWILPNLVQLVAERREEPVDQLEPTIREIIAEQDFTDDCGDGVVSDRHDAVMDFYVCVVTRTLQQLRQHAIRCGAWSDAPAPIGMFG